MTTTAPSRSPAAVAVLGAAVLAAALLIVGAAWLGWRALAGGGGPVETSPTRLSYTAETFEEVAFSAIDLRNRGDEPAVIESVTPVDPPMGLDVLGALAYDTREQSSPTPVTTYPPELDARDAVGTRLPARAGSNVKLALVVRATRAGRFVIGSTEVRYRVGDKRHRVVVPAHVTLCATREDSERGCG